MHFDRHALSQLNNTSTITLLIKTALKESLLFFDDDTFWWDSIDNQKLTQQSTSDLIQHRPSTMRCLDGQQL
jgi:hypothetical protein